MDIAFVGHRCCDHSPSSGYDQICSLFPEAGWMDGRALEAGRIEWIRAPQAAMSASPRILHVIYGDCSGKALPALLRARFPGSLIISSVHQPVVRLRADVPARAALDASDAIVTVSRAQARELKDLGLTAPIFAIPHGVWTEAFRPASEVAYQNRDAVLLVGSFLRDWAGARRVVEDLSRKGIRSTALGAGPREHLVDDPCVDVRPRVPESELASLYDRAAAVFLPFLEATASNALLEAMAAGCPVVCPRLPSLVEEYLGDDSDSFEAGDYEQAVARLLFYVRNPTTREEKGRDLRARSLEFDWSHVRHRYASTYEAVAALRSGGG
jgi:glycosyltransferase involved in cell wall biosynthesis